MEKEAGRNSGPSTGSWLLMIFGDQEIMLYLTGVILLLTFTLMVIGIIIKSLRRNRK